MNWLCDCDPEETVNVSRVQGHIQRIEWLLNGGYRAQTTETE